MNNISISFTRTDQLCVLAIINTHTFSGLLISWVFIMFMLNIARSEQSSHTPGGSYQRL